tara:strand:+ start:257 stop:706 length:450 start_codon:yes stop_codon:yes gene_type:complete
MECVDTFLVHRKKFQEILYEDPMYRYVIHTVLQWRYLKAACAGYLFNDNKYLQNISIEHWDKLADKCWGKYPSRHGPNSLADRVLTLKECVRLRCDTTLAEALKERGLLSEDSEGDNGEGSMLASVMLASVSYAKLRQIADTCGIGILE